MKLIFSGLFLMNGLREMLGQILKKIDPTGLPFPRPNSPFPFPWPHQISTAPLLGHQMVGFLPEHCFCLPSFYNFWDDYVLRWFLIISFFFHFFRWLRGWEVSSSFYELVSALCVWICIEVWINCKRCILMLNWELFYFRCLSHSTQAAGY